MSAEPFQLDFSRHVLEIVEKYDPYAFEALEYGEPGYSLPEKRIEWASIIMANWNNVPKHVYNALERRGFGLEWVDEWINVDNCNGDIRAYRSEGDSWGWKPSYIIIDGDVYGKHQMTKGSEELKEYIEHLTNNHSKADTFGIEWEKEHGAKLFNDEQFKNDWYGNSDNPKEILTEALKQKPEGKFIFQIPLVHQWGVEFNLYELKQTVDTEEL